MDRALLHRLWGRWASQSIGRGQQPLTGAAIISVSSDRPSRFYSLIVEQEGLLFKASDVRPIVESMRDSCLHSEYFYVGADKYLVTTVVENVYCARNVNTKNAGVIIYGQPPYVVIATYQGALCAATKAFSAMEELMEQLIIDG